MISQDLGRGGFWELPKCALTVTHLASTDTRLARNSTVMPPACLPAYTEKMARPIQG